MDAFMKGHKYGGISKNDVILALTTARHCEWRQFADIWMGLKTREEFAEEHNEFFKVKNQFDEETKGFIEAIDMNWKK